MRDNGSQVVVSEKLKADPGNKMINRQSKNERGSGSITATRIVVVILVSVIFLFTYFAFLGYFSEKKETSYLPDFDKRSRSKSSERNETVELSNQWYRLRVAKSGNVQVDNLNGETILAGLTYFYDYENGRNGSQLQDISVKILNDSVITINGMSGDDVNVTISLTVCRNRQKLDVSVKSSYLNNITVLRESLIAEFNNPVSVVFLKNSETETRPFADEYWVDKQGVQFGEGEASALIYHTPDISSLQVQSRENLLFVNLDYYRDHPFIRIPFQEDGGGKWIDISASKYKPGDERVNTFTMHFGLSPDVLPRFMPVPGGYLAGYIFTEHADGGNIRTHRAAYFGSEDITSASNATGGFWGHQIPVTKSVFFDEFDDGVSCQNDSCSMEREYLEFLDQLHVLGNDLCLHTPDSGNSNHKIMEEAMVFMKERYDTRTWIDHGMYPGNTNREAYSADGLDPATEYYAADLWEENNVMYFWSPAVEALRFAIPGPSLTQLIRNYKLKASYKEFRRRYNFLRIYEDAGALEALVKVKRGNLPMLELNSQRPFMGYSFPTPLYWQNPTYSGQLYSWTTEFDYYGVTGQLDSANLIIEKRQLEHLIAKRGVFFNHGYYVRNNSRDGMLTFHDGKLIVNPYFDEVLKYMDHRRDDGDLLITTVRDLMDYRLQIENIVLDYWPDGSVDIVNNNHHEVRDLALAIRSDPENIRLEGAEFLSRKVKDDAIIWFNLPADSKVNLNITDKKKKNSRHLSN